MSDLPDAIGRITHGSLLARALEPTHGEGVSDGHSQQTACLNCGTPLIGPHCHRCGQHAQVHKTLGAFFHDLLHGVFHFEGKIWRTVPALVLHPGRLTHEYIDGRRATYVSPIALFLFCVFLMFAVVKSFGFDFGNAANITVNDKSVRGLEANRAELARLQRLRTTLVAEHKSTAAIDGEINGRKQGIRVIEQISDPMTAADSSGELVSASSKLPALDAALQGMKENPQLALFRLQSNAYKFAWLLIPISVPFIWLLFAFRRRFGIYDHTIFVTYSLCFMMLLLSTLTLGSQLGVPLVTVGMTLVPPLHIYRQLKGTYALSRLSALWRTVAVTGYAFIALTIFAIALVAIEALE